MLNWTPHNAGVGSSSLPLATNTPKNRDPLGSPVFLSLANRVGSSFVLKMKLLAALAGHIDRGKMPPDEHSVR